MSSHRDRPLTELRRKDRGVDDEAFLEERLRASAFGVLAMADGDQPVVNINLFAYDATRRVIYLHTARTGRTRETIEANPRVAFVAGEMGRLLPADEALEFSVEYASVIVFGKAHVVEDEAEARTGLQLLLDRYAPHLRPGEHYRGITDDELERTAVYRVNIEGWSGKRKAAEPDFPGAYRFGEESGGDTQRHDR